MFDFLKKKTSCWFLVLFFLLVTDLSIVKASEFKGKGFETENMPYVAVSESAEMNVLPDCAYIDFGVETFNEDLVTAQRENNLRAEAIQKFLLLSGIEKKLISTKNFSVQVVNDSKNHNQVKGYRINNTVKVRVDNLEIIGAVINGAVLAGANHVSGLSFSLKDPFVHRLAVLEMAVEKAMQKAEVMAKAAGKSVKGVLSISEGSVRGADLYRSYNKGVAETVAMAINTPIQAGELSFFAEVTVVCLLGN